ncbi:MoxR family ATPase [bacterium]|nr:MoxR family ATPase [bacterium]
MLFEGLGIYGWKEQDENLALASLLTGDPLLLIGNHGCAKTLLACKIAQALGKRFLVYDASKAMFEDVLGYPNVERLKEGAVEYISSAVTVWDKEIILIDELNRALPELQSKWLEIIRSRRIMGYPTQVKWVWAAMNPMSYSATNALEEALIGRFALFLYPPDVLQMNETDRIRVAIHLNGDDAPSLSEWLPGVNGRTVHSTDLAKIGKQLLDVLFHSARHFVRLRDTMSTLPQFLAKFADLLMRESKGEIALDGRRLGFLYRNLLANRAIELAKADLLGTPLGSFIDSARYTVQSSIPVGLNDESLKREEAVHKMEICFDLLSAYFEEGSEIAKVDLVYELFTTDDLMRKAEILLRSQVGDLAKTKAWTDLTNDDHDITLLAYTALQIEARRPGTIPPELLESLSAKIPEGKLTSASLPSLTGQSIEYVDDVEAILQQDTDLGKLVAFNRIRELAEMPNLKPADLDKARSLIQQDIATFETLITNGGAQS